MLFLLVHGYRKLSNVEGGRTSNASFAKVGTQPGGSTHLEKVGLGGTLKRSDSGAFLSEGTHLQLVRLTDVIQVWTRDYRDLNRDSN